MISLKKYLDSVNNGSTESSQSGKEDILVSTIQMICTCLRELGNCSVRVCPALGTELKESLRELETGLLCDVSRVTMEATTTSVQKKLEQWSRQVSEYYRQKATEVRNLLTVMARTAESFGARDQRCASQLAEIADRLDSIESLEDLTEVRAAVHFQATELRSSVERLTSDGRHAIAQLRAEVSAYRVKLEKTEESASRDSLTGLRNRLWVEKQIERRISSNSPFSVAIVDIDGFKLVNDQHGHLVGDELLQQFSAELRSASRTSDVVGRWGGDEFILVLDGTKQEVAAHIERLASRACRNYTVESLAGPLSLPVDASFGVAEFISGGTLRELLSRADTMMYKVKGNSLATGRTERKVPPITERRNQLPRLDDGVKQTCILKSLVVEDNATDGLLLQTFLSSYGVCDIALDGREAVSAVADAHRKHQSYGLICMDIRMPHMDGLEAIREIRKHEAVAQVADTTKIIVTTSHTDIENIAGALLGRCNACLTKPIEIPRLRRELETLGLVR